MALPLPVDRRLFYRIATSLPIEFKVGDQISKGRTVDLSEGGLFISTPWPVKSGSGIKIKLKLLSKETVKILGTVVRVVPTNKGEDPGLGIRFEQLPGNDIACLHSYLKRRVTTDSLPVVNTKSDSEVQRRQIARRAKITGELPSANDTFLSNMTPDVAMKAVALSFPTKEQMRHKAQTKRKQQNVGRVLDHFVSGTSLAVKIVTPVLLLWGIAMFCGMMIDSLTSNF
jgi:Tfp pilus assembly protein PilZ